MSERIENHCISIELSIDCKFSDGSFVDCKCSETEVARNRNDYHHRRPVESEEDTILTTDAFLYLLKMVLKIKQTRQQLLQ